ncbi:MAG TPA: hypothetical protein VMW65_15355 [Chloroflexota bacterium]|nr:hypothetical protein [Chloroflexota bacterium]
MRFVVAFFEFWYDFIVGDAWEIAAGIIVVLAIGAILVRSQAVSTGLIPPIVGFGIIMVVALSTFFEARKRAGA